MYVFEHMYNCVFPCLDHEGRITSEDIPSRNCITLLHFWIDNLSLNESFGWLLTWDNTQYQSRVCNIQYHTLSTQYESAISCCEFRLSYRKVMSYSLLISEYFISLSIIRYYDCQHLDNRNWTESWHRHLSLQSIKIIRLKNIWFNKLCLY